MRVYAPVVREVAFRVWTHRVLRKQYRDVRSPITSFNGFNLLIDLTYSFAAILFGYQVCSKKGMIEFPYVNSKLILIPIYNLRPEKC